MMQLSRKATANRYRRAALALCTAGATLSAGLLAAGPGAVPGHASNHVDSPGQILDPQMDVTDLYAFTSPDRPDTVTVIWNYIPFELPVVPLPWYRFATQGFYDLHFDNTGDGAPDLTYRWWYRNGDGSGDAKAPPSSRYPAIPQQGENYDPSDYTKLVPRQAARALIPQTYKLELIRPGEPPRTLLDNAPVAPWPLGLDYTSKFDQAIVPIPGGGVTFSGPVKDPFYFDFRIFSLLRTGNPVAPPVDILLPFNVHSIAIQIPKSELALNGDVHRNPVVGIWATSSRKSLNLTGGSDEYRQVSRQGLSMFGDSVNPPHLRDLYHASSPADDHAWRGLRDAVRHPYVAKLAAPGTLTFPSFGPRLDHEQIFLTGIAKETGPIKIDLNSHLLNRDVNRSKVVPAEMTRLNMTTPVTANPNKYGLIEGDLQGWPNGRRLGDDVTTAYLRVALGEPLRRRLLLTTFSPLQGPAKRLRPDFPYVATPDLRR
ncbi:DUF4331 domain-containing protein [Rhizohabitans arisaemae]|uniref:DUF4331 domain-containing protein n=1 Tax=Rhizohabitans arisaemae TaxID=2720610 RepID=UPI0024B243F0|nr:DUF4331 domain-containing protein [Rhizohabitans arisaemae]